MILMASKASVERPALSKHGSNGLILKRREEIKANTLQSDGSAMDKSVCSSLPPSTLLWSCVVCEGAWFSAGGVRQGERSGNTPVIGAAVQG